MKWIHHLLKGISLSGALFAFQACYGTPRPALYEELGEAPMSFILLSHSTGEPLKGIHIVGGFSTWEYRELGVSGTDGKCRVSIPYIQSQGSSRLSFEDPDGKYIVKDTTLTDLRDREILIHLDPVQ